MADIVSWTGKSDSFFPSQGFNPLPLFVVSATVAVHQFILIPYLV